MTGLVLLEVAYRHHHDGGGLLILGWLARAAIWAAVWRIADRLPLSALLAAAGAVAALYVAVRRRGRSLR